MDRQNSTCSNRPLTLYLTERRGRIMISVWVFMVLLLYPVRVMNARWSTQTNGLNTTAHDVIRFRPQTNHMGDTAVRRGHFAGRCWRLVISFLSTYNETWLMHVSVSCCMHGGNNSISAFQFHSVTAIKIVTVYNYRLFVHCTVIVIPQLL